VTVTFFAAILRLRSANGDCHLFFSPLPSSIFPPSLHSPPPVPPMAAKGDCHLFLSPFSSPPFLSSIFPPSQHSPPPAPPAAAKGDCHLFSSPLPSSLSPLPLCTPLRRLRRRRLKVTVTFFAAILRLRSAIGDCHLFSSLFFVAILRLRSANGDCHLFFATSSLFSFPPSLAALPAAGGQR